jgi:hypothetical protein
MCIHRRHDGERRTVDRQALWLSRTEKSIALTLLAGMNGPWPGRLYRSRVWSGKIFCWRSDWRAGWARLYVHENLDG